jgi:hypothetical protein
MIRPPSDRVVYERLEGSRIRVRHLWGLVDGNVRGEDFEYDPDGQVVLHTRREAAPSRTERPDPWEWEAFRRLERLTDCVSPVFPPSLLRTRNVTGLARWPATGTHRVANSCRAGHHEVIEVWTERDLIAAMTAGCRYQMPDGQVCKALVNVSRHINGAGIELGMVWIPDERTPPDSPGAAR